MHQQWLQTIPMNQLLKELLRSWINNQEEDHRCNGHLYYEQHPCHVVDLQEQCPILLHLKFLLKYHHEKITLISSVWNLHLISSDDRQETYSWQPNKMTIRTRIFDFYPTSILSSKHYSHTSNGTIAVEMDWTKVSLFVATRLVLFNSPMSCSSLFLELFPMSAAEIVSNKAIPLICFEWFLTTHCGWVRLEWDATWAAVDDCHIHISQTMWRHQAQWDASNAT